MSNNCKKTRLYNVDPLKPPLKKTNKQKTHKKKKQKQKNIKELLDL